MAMFDEGMECTSCGTADPNNHDELCEIYRKVPGLVELFKNDYLDLINHPPHHRSDTPYETTKVIEEWDLGWHLGNVLKYIARHELKGDSIEDLKKARWYLNRYIALMEAENDHKSETPTDAQQSRGKEVSTRAEEEES